MKILSVHELPFTIIKFIKWRPDICSQRKKERYYTRKEIVYHLRIKSFLPSSNRFGILELIIKNHLLRFLLLANCLIIDIFSPNFTFSRCAESGSLLMLHDITAFVSSLVVVCVCLCVCVWGVCVTVKISCLFLHILIRPLNQISRNPWQELYGDDDDDWLYLRSWWADIRDSWESHNSS